MHCSTCANHDLVAIRLTIASRGVTMYRCARCDSRQWAGDGGEMTRDGVLDLVRASR